jgi:hypothetical protein
MTLLFLITLKVKLAKIPDVTGIFVPLSARRLDGCRKSTCLGVRSKMIPGVVRIKQDCAEKRCREGSQGEI